MSKYDIAERKRELKTQIDLAENQLKKNLVNTFDRSPSLLDLKRLLPLGIDVLPWITSAMSKFQSSKKKGSTRSTWLPWATIVSMLVQWYLKKQKSAKK